MFLVYGTVGIFLITVLVAYAYLKKPVYGISLAITAIVLIIIAVSWNLTENMRATKVASKIPLEQLTLSEQSLKPAYGNRYLYQAKLNNLSSSHQLKSIQLQLTLSDGLSTQVNDEKLSQWAKVWLTAKSSEQIKVYFTSNKLAKPIQQAQWKVIVVGSKAR